MAGACPLQSRTGPTSPGARSARWGRCPTL